MFMFTMCLMHNYNGRSQCGNLSDSTQVYTKQVGIACPSRGSSHANAYDHKAVCWAHSTVVYTVNERKFKKIHPAASISVHDLQVIHACEMPRVCSHVVLMLKRGLQGSRSLSHWLWLAHKKLSCDTALAWVYSCYPNSALLTVNLRNAKTKLLSDVHNA